MKFNNLSDAKLEKLVNKARDELHMRRIKQEQIKKTHTEIMRLIKNAGLTTIEDLLGSHKSRKVAPKWRHKEDTSLTWAGRGRQPKWIKKYGVKI